MNWDCLHSLPKNKQSTALRTYFSIQSICVLYLYKYNRLFYAKCNGCMPVRAVCKPHSPDLKRGALATDARGCSLWRSLLERPPSAQESRVRDPLGELARTRVGGVTKASDSSSINKTDATRATFVYWDCPNTNSKQLWGHILTSKVVFCILINIIVYFMQSIRLFIKQ